MTLALTWRNLWRNRRRSLITLSSVSFAVMLAIVMGSLQKGVFDNLVNDVVSFYSGYIQVHRKGYWEEQVLDQSFAQDTQVLRRLDPLPGVRAIVPRLESFALASSGNLTRGCLVAGTDKDREARVTRLPQKMIRGQYLDGKGTGIILGEGLAAKLRVGVDDTLVLLGQGYQGSMAAGKYRILGLLHFGAPALNSSMVYMDMQTAQAFLGAEQRLTSLALALDNPRDLARIQRQVEDTLGADYEVMSWAAMMPEIENHIRADRFSLGIMIGILYLIIAFGLFSTLMMMMAERRYEFGMLVAIGMQKKILARMLLMEHFLLTILGTLAGMAISLPIVLYLEHRPLRFTGKVAAAYEQFGFEAVFPATVDGTIFLNQALIVMSLALLIALYPILRVSRLDPVAAMKK